MGALGSYFRVFTFMKEVLGMVKDHPKLLTPMGINLAVATVVNLIVAVLYMVLGGDESIIAYAFMAFGLVALYFIDYFCAGLAVSMIHDQVTEGNAEIGKAFSRTLKASPGILILATVSGILDLLASQARENGGIAGRLILFAIRIVWTTATYVLMPAMVIEGTGFFGAFKRSKELMKNDPTQIGVGVVGIGLVSFLIGIVTFGLAFAQFRVLSGVPLLPVLIFFFLVNVYWSTTSYLRTTYYTCFYLWARECEKNGVADPALAPQPLANTVAPVFAGG